jgi:hypothetical protein
MQVFVCASVGCDPRTPITQTRNISATEKFQLLILGVINKYLYILHFVINI